jgi:hypothetical protein
MAASYASIGGLAVIAGAGATVTYNSEGAVVTATDISKSTVATVYIPVPSPADSKTSLTDYWVQCSGVQNTAVANHITINYGGGDPIENRALRGTYRDIRETTDSAAIDFNDDNDLPRGINVTLELNFTKSDAKFAIHSISLGFIGST